MGLSDGVLFLAGNEHVTNRKNSRIGSSLKRVSLKQTLMFSAYHNVLYPASLSLQAGVNKMAILDVTNANLPGLQQAKPEADAENPGDGNDTAQSPNYPESGISIVDRFIDEPRRLRVANLEVRNIFITTMREHLSKKPELLDILVPDFSANYRRPTPGPGYLEAITEDNVHYIQTPIRKVTTTGIETIDGEIRDVDAILCATGANVDIAPPFSIRAYGVDLKDAWKPEGQSAFPYTCLGLVTPGFPNLFFIYGPHRTGASGTIPHNVEIQLTYYAKVLLKVAREGIKTITPSKKAADEFVDYFDAHFVKTVLSDNCSSWYNSGRPGLRIHGPWPSSGMHVTAVRREPRWEDWEYIYLSESGNRFVWYFGNGSTRKETDPKSDATPYLKLPSEIDLRDVHESWWDSP